MSRRSHSNTVNESMAFLYPDFITPVQNVEADLNGKTCPTIGSGGEVFDLTPSGSCQFLICFLFTLFPFRERNYVSRTDSHKKAPTSLYGCEKTPKGFNVNRMGWE